MKEHKLRRIWFCGMLREIHVNEIIIRAGPTLAFKARLGRFVPTRIQRRPDGLQLAARQPSGGAVFHRRTPAALCKADSIAINLLASCAICTPANCSKRLKIMTRITLNATPSAHPRFLASRAQCPGSHDAPPCASLARFCDKCW